RSQRRLRRFRHPRPLPPPTRIRPRSRRPQPRLRPRPRPRLRRRRLPSARASHTGSLPRSRPQCRLRRFRPMPAQPRPRRPRLLIWPCAPSRTASSSCSTAARSHAPMRSKPRPDRTGCAACTRWVRASCRSTWPRDPIPRWWCACSRTRSSIPRPWGASCGSMAVAAHPPVGCRWARSRSSCARATASSNPSPCSTCHRAPAASYEAPSAALPDPDAAVAADAGRRRNLESFRMARPLLRGLGVGYRWFGMRAVAAWVVLAVGGCLYTDDINQRPIVRGIAYDPAPTRSDRPFDVTIDAIDLDGDSIQVSWSLTDPQGMATPGREARVHVSPHSQPGNWNLDGEAVDEPGASTPFHAVILVPNLAPHIDRITVNPPPGSGNYALL